MDETLRKVLQGNKQEFSEALENIDKSFEDDSAFRNLAEEEACEFRKWAQENYEPGEPISSIWHPVVRNECALMNQGIIFDPEKRNRAQALARRQKSS